MKRVCWMTLKCSAEPKRRYVAQIAVFAAKSEPLWLRNKMYPQGQESGLRHRAAQRYAEISVSDSRFSLCPAGCVSRYNKQGLCVPQKSPSQPKSADSLGAQPPIPRRKERDAMGKDVRIAVRVTAIEKEKIQAKARKCGLSTTEYVKQRALGYEPRTVPPDALFACLEKLGELADKASSPELDKEICTVLKQITAEFLLPGKG